MYMYTYPAGQHTNKHNTNSIKPNKLKLYIDIYIYIYIHIRLYIYVYMCMHPAGPGSRPRDPGHGGRWGRRGGPLGGRRY